MTTMGMGDDEDRLTPGDTPGQFCFEFPLSSYYNRNVGQVGNPAQPSPKRSSVLCLLVSI